MKRGHALLVSLLIGAAAIFGIVAASHTLALGRASRRPTISSAQIAAHDRALNQTEAKLRRMLAQRQPAAAASATTPAPHRVIYVRPAPHIVTVHRPGGGEHEAEAGEGGGFDD